MRGAAAAALVPLLIASQARARDFTTQAVGTTAAEYLTVDVGARAVAMGGAYTAAANDATSLYWNPAGLAQIPRAALTFTRENHPGPITFDYGAYAHRLSPGGVAAAGFRLMDAGSIASTDIDGNSLGSMHPRSYTWEAGYGQQLLEMSDGEAEMTMGTVARYSHADMVSHGDIFCGDLGVQMRHGTALLPWRFGAVVQNIGVGPKYDATRDRLPLRGRLGMALEPTRFWLFTLDATLPVDDQASLSAGGEVTLEAQENLQAFLRGGVDTFAIAQHNSGLRGISFGVGIRAFGLMFDYAFAPLGLLGDTHLFSVTWNLSHLGSRRYRER